jgi:parvulin-like peptidyl-prolyl isomerase
MNSRIIFSTMIAAVLCAFTGAQAAGTNDMAGASLGNPVIARGTGFEIKRGDLDDAMTGIRAAAAAQNQAISPEQEVRLEKQILNRIIDSKLLLAKATDEDKAAGKKAADLHMTALLENLGSQEKFDQQLKAAGETADEERSRYADQITVQTALLRELKISVSDEDVQKFFDDHRISAFEAPEMVRISHILIFTNDPVTHLALTSDQQQSQRVLLDGVVKSIREGVDFETVAKQYSEDIGSKASGGELPPFPRGQMAPEIDAAAFSLTNNQVSGIIATSAGYQIIKVLQKIPAQKTGYLEAAPKIKEYLTQQQAQKLEAPYLEGLRAAAGVVILDPSLKGTDAASPNP